MPVRESVRGVVQSLRLGAGLWRRARAHRRGNTQAQQAAETWIADLLGREHGPLAKVGQMLAGRLPALGNLQEQAQALSEDAAWVELAKAWQADPAHYIHAWSPACAAASLGQVHRAQLHDGRQVAIKIQYPGLRARCQGVLAALGLLPGMGPLKRYGVDLEAHRQQLQTIMEQELDYCSEAQRQNTYAQAYPAQLGLVVPRPVLELCRSTILVQTWEEGQTLAEAALWPAPARQRAGRRLVQHVLCGMAKGVCLHADPHAGNIRLRPDGLLLYDFGCCTRFLGSQAWLCLIQALRDQAPADALDLLTAIGFDAEKLWHLGERLPRLAQILCEPFLQHAPWDCRQWQPAAAIRALLGEQAWWFRSAGGPALLLPLRVYTGLVAQLRVLDARLDWWQELQGLAASELAQATTFQAPSQSQGRVRIDSLARKLRVQVQRGGREVVDVTLPPTALPTLAQWLDPDTLARITQRGIQVDTVIAQALAGGLVPGPVFTLDEGDRHMWVWLE